MSAEPITENAIEVKAVIVPPEKPKHPRVLTLSVCRRGVNSLQNYLKATRCDRRGRGGRRMCRRDAGRQHGDGIRERLEALPEVVLGSPSNGASHDAYDCGALHIWDRQGREQISTKEPINGSLHLAAIDVRDKRELQFLPARQKYSEICVMVQGIMRAKGS